MSFIRMRLLTHHRIALFDAQTLFILQANNISHIHVLTTRLQFPTFYVVEQSFIPVCNNSSVTRNNCDRNNEHYD